MILSILKLDYDDYVQTDHLLKHQCNLIHRVQEKGVRTPDAEYYNKLLHTNKRYYDVKAPKKSNSIKSKNCKITHAFDQAKGQTKNIIISLLRDECDLSNI